MTELLLIRHGLPVDGSLEPSLGDEGQKQAERMAAWLATQAIDGIATSPLLRARQTAAPAEALLGIDAVVVPDLREWVRDGPPPLYHALENIPAADPRSMALAEGRFEDFVPPFDWDAFRQQAASALDEICRRWPGGRVAAFSHGGTINTLLAGVLGTQDLFWFIPGYTSVSRVERLASGRTVIRSVNEQPGPPAAPLRVAAAAAAQMSR